MKINYWKAFIILLAIFSLTRSAYPSAFYVEEKKDGRIYVFNDPKQYKLFKESGELEVRITRIAAGPEGETIYFDSTEAIHMYNFKHNLPAEVIIEPEVKKPTQKFAWKDGKTTWESDNAALTLSNRIQFRYTFEDPEGLDTRGSFRIRRAKTKLDGWFYNKHLTYELQMNWADTTNALEDANFNIDISKNKKFMIKAGQFKVPFGRQELTSSGNQQFVDRTLVSNEFAKGRDIGVQLWGLAMNEKLDWRVGIFNGTGRNKTTNDNSDYQFNAKLTWQPWGDVKYSEGDFESSDKPLLALGAQFENNEFVDITANFLQIKRTILGPEFAFKYKGLFLTSEYFFRTIRRPDTPEFDSPGWYVQGGYFLVPKILEIAGRYGTWDPSESLNNNSRIEKGVAVSYYYNKHNLKFQGDFRQIEDEAKNSTNNELRFQLQFIF